MCSLDDGTGTTAPAATLAPCRWCGSTHGPLCPWVKSMEFHPDGTTVKRVVFHDPVPWQSAGQNHLIAAEDPD